VESGCTKREAQSLLHCSVDYLPAVLRNLPTHPWTSMRPWISIHEPTAGILRVIAGSSIYYDSIRVVIPVYTIIYAYPIFSQRQTLAERRNKLKSAPTASHQQGRRMTRPRLLSSPPPLARTPLSLPLAFSLNIPMACLPCSGR
jgi:hypothetical protein